MEPVPRVLIILQKSQSLPALIQSLFYFGDAPSVFILEAVDQVEPFLDLHEFGGVKSQIPDIVVQGPVEIGEQVLHLRELVRYPVQIRVDAAH